MLLATVLDVPLRERNTLLLAAGFAPIYRETKLDARELEPVRAALDAILRRQEPYPAVVMNRRRDILGSNDAARNFFGFLLGRQPELVGERHELKSEANVLRLMFDPRGLRPHVRNWEAVAEVLVARVHREAVGGVKDAATAELLKEVLTYPEVPRRLGKPSLETPLVPVISIEFAKNGEVFHFFSAVTTLGTPQDITVQEMRIESFFPADAETASRARRLAESR